MKRNHQMRNEDDFPYYNGFPCQVDGKGWLFLLASLALAFAALSSMPLRTFPLKMIPALLFLAIPLLALRRVTGSHWLTLFRPVWPKDLGLMVLFAAITLIGSVGMGLLLSRVFELNHNPVAESMASLSTAELVTMLLPTVPQLIGDELFGILPFLAVLWFCVTRLKLSRLTAIVIALIVSGLVFGALHLPTYDWNWAQSLLGIGFARILLTLAYLATRNLWVSAGAHILNDWAGFLIAFSTSPVPNGTE